MRSLQTITQSALFRFLLWTICFSLIAWNFLARGPVHLAPSEKMHMDMINRLTRWITQSLSTQNISRNEEITIYEDSLLTPCWTIVNHNPNTIVKAFLFCYQFRCVKKTPQNLTVPFLGLHSDAKTIIRTVSNSCSETNCKAAKILWDGGVVTGKSVTRVRWFPQHQIPAKMAQIVVFYTFSTRKILDHCFEKLHNEADSMGRDLVFALWQVQKLSRILYTEM